MLWSWCLDDSDNRSRFVYADKAPDWLHHRKHIERRSHRKGETEQNTLLEWADDRLVGIGRIPRRRDPTTRQDGRLWGTAAFHAIGRMNLTT